MKKTRSNVGAQKVCMINNLREKSTLKSLMSATETGKQMDFF